MKDKINQELQKIEIPESLHEKSKSGVNSAKVERKKRMFNKSTRVNYKKWISVASVCGILLAIIISTAFLNNNANFVITAYALSDDSDQDNKNLSSEKAVFELLTKDRVDGDLISVSGDGANLIFTDVLLKITGEHIDSIAYTMSKGTFIENVALTAKDLENSKRLIAENIYIIHGVPGSDIYEGIKEIGNTYSVKYNEQDKYEYKLAIPHDGTSVISNGIIIEVIVKYTDGNVEQQEIVVTQESDSISLKLN